MPGPLTGLIPAAHTPFTVNGALDPGIVRQQAALLLEMDIQGVFVGGTTGEFSSLTVEERMILADSWCQAAGGALRVVVHVGHNCQAEAIRLARHARECGAVAVAAMAPSYFKPTAVRELIDFCIRSPSRQTRCPSISTIFRE